MSANAAYLDTSAFLKLIVEEPESVALKSRLTRWGDRVSASLLRVETVRALRRSGNDDLVGPARQLMATMHLLALDFPLLEMASELGPSSLRSLDAIHLAAARSISPDVAAFITYDERLGNAATSQGFVVESPGS